MWKAVVMDDEMSLGDEGRATAHESGHTINYEGVGTTKAKDTGRCTN